MFGKLPRPSPAGRLVPEAVLATLDVDCEGGLPALLTCPSCHRAALYVARDGVLGGAWCRCSGCGVTGDLIELAASAWSLTPPAAVRKLHGLGHLDGDVEAALADHATHLSSRAAVTEFWTSCGNAPTALDTSRLVRTLRRFGLSQAARDGARSWREGIGRFVGIAGGAAIKSLMRPVGGVRSVSGAGWDRALVIPFLDYPGRIRGFFLASDAGDPESGSTAWRRVNVPGPSGEGTREAGIALLGALDGPGVGGLTGVVSSDLEFVIALQAEHLDRSGTPLPLAATRESEGDRTRLAFDGVRRRGPLVIMGVDAGAFRQARRGGLLVAPAALVRDRRAPLAVLETAATEAVGWESALEKACEGLDDTTAESLLLEVGLDDAALRRFAEDAHEGLQPMLGRLVDARGTPRSIEVAGRTVAEDAKGWWLVHPSRPRELVSDAIIRVDRVLECRGRMSYVGRILAFGVETPFRLGPEFAADPFAAVHALLVREGIGVITYGHGWTKHALAIAQQFHRPSPGHGLSRVGWDRTVNALVLPRWLIAPGGLSRHDDFAAAGRVPCESVDPGEGPTLSDFRGLHRGGAGTVTLAVAAFVLADLLDSRAGRPRSRLAVVGDGAFAAVRHAAAECGLLSAGPDAVRARADDHDWPMVVDRRVTADEADTLPGGVIAPVTRPVATALAAGGGWHILDADVSRDAVSPPGAAGHVLFGHLLDLASRRFATPGGDSLTFVLDDQRKWLVSTTRFSFLPEPRAALRMRTPAGHLFDLILLMASEAAGLPVGEVDPCSLKSDMARRGLGEFDVDRAASILREAGALLDTANGQWTLDAAWTTANAHVPPPRIYRWRQPKKDEGEA